MVLTVMITLQIPKHTAVQEQQAQAVKMVLDFMFHQTALPLELQQTVVHCAADTVILQTTGQKAVAVDLVILAVEQELMKLLVVFGQLAQVDQDMLIHHCVQILWRILDLTKVKIQMQLVIQIGLAALVYLMQALLVATEEW
jgi:hypothetical protein